MLLRAAAIMRAGSGEDATYWRNILELDKPGLNFFDPAEAGAIADIVKTFFRRVLFNIYVVDRVVVSTYAEEVWPIVDDFVVKTYGEAGLRHGHHVFNQVLPLQACVIVSKVTERRHAGRMWLRGVVGEENIQASPTGSLLSLHLDPLITEVNDGFVQMKTELAAVGYRIVLAKGAEPTPEVREVVDFQVKGIAFRKLRRRTSKRLSVKNPLRGIDDFLKAVNYRPEVVNALLSAWNALPYPDVPLLPE